MKFVPYALTGDRSVIAFQVDGIGSAAAADVAALLAQLKPAHLLVHFPWYGMYEVGLQLARLQRGRASTCQIHFMVNTVAEVSLFRGTGMPVFHAPASLFVSERIFDIHRVPKEHDAIYVAHFRPGYPDHVKRQYLAAGIRRLRLVTYPVRHEIPNGTFACQLIKNFPELVHAEINDHYLSPQEVATAMNGARVNLALSAVEGCMYAFTEGLLCGVPAVSTTCMGGREQFFHSRYVEVADANPEAIARAVERMQLRENDPNDVRRFALSRLEQYRRPYMAYIGELCGKDPDLLYGRLFEGPGGPVSVCVDFERSTPSDRRMV